MWIILLVILLIFYIIYSFNRFITYKNRIKNAFAQIDVQLKKRADLIPKLVKVVKGYAKHERSVLESITKIRSELLKSVKAKDLKNIAKQDYDLTNLLKRLFVVVENYPDLKANKNFLVLQEEITAIEDKIAFARQLYNDLVMHYNNLIEKFPTNIMAKLFSFKKYDFYKAEESDKKDVKIDL